MEKSITTSIKNSIQKYMESSHRRSALIIAHRGGSKSFSQTENTLELFEVAIFKQVQMIEFDVRQTKDNQLVIFHNDHINGTKLKTLTYEELCLLAKKENLSISLFGDVLNICSNRVMLDIELKEEGYEQEVISILGKFYSSNHYVITSFLDSVIHKVKTINPNIKAGLLIGKEHATLKQRLSELFPFHRLKKAKADFIVPNYRLVTPWLLISCKKLKYNVYVWTVNTDSIYTKLIRKKVHGIITDYPDRFTGNYNVLKIR